MAMSVISFKISMRQSLQLRVKKSHNVEHWFGDSVSTTQIRHQQWKTHTHTGTHYQLYIILKRYISNYNLPLRQRGVCSRGIALLFL